MRRLLAVVFWSVIAAAFIGPGTVTTAAKSGADYGVALLWALVFSTLATLVLQEASARLTAASGRDLARALRESYRRGPGGPLVLVLVIGAIGLGCAAYEAGNLLGAAAGAGLIMGISPSSLALVAGVLAGALLWVGAPKAVAHALSALVAVMGVAFLVTGLSVLPPLGELVRGAFVPVAPAGSGLLVLGLVGTTVVPYNLFLGSGLAAGQKLEEIRFGLAVAVLLGGLISMGIVVVGASLDGSFAFGALADELATRLGPWAAQLFGWGLAAAGLTSAVTAPLAAALTARGLFGEGPEDERWSPRSWRYRSVWLTVLAVGVGFGVSGVRPVPAILLAQALNGVLLPVAAIFLLLAVNDRRLLGPDALNGPLANGVTAVVVAVTVALGASGVLRAGAATFALDPPGQRLLLTVAAVAVLVLSYPVARAIRARRRPAKPADP